jgi:hypothetical protein
MHSENTLKRKASSTHHSDREGRLAGNDIYDKLVVAPWLKQGPV